MPRSGGVYSPPSGTPVTPNTVASSTDFNAFAADIGAELTNSIARDGQSPATADLPMGNHKHTGVANGTARTHYAALGQIQDGVVTVAGSVSGVDTITAALSPAISAYTAGMRISFIPAGTNTGAATLALNGIASPKDIYKYEGVDLEPGDLQSTRVAHVFYDGTAFQLLNPAPYPITTAEDDASVTPSNLVYPPLSVLRYGADPTGVADSTAAFQKMLSVVHAYASGTGSAGLGGARGYIPAGRYKISSPLVIYKSGVVIEGESAKSVEIFCSDTFPSGYKPIWDLRASSGGRAANISVSLRRMSLFASNPYAVSWDGFTPDRIGIWHTGLSDVAGPCGFDEIYTRGFAVHHRGAESWVFHLRDIRMYGPSNTNRGGIGIDWANTSGVDYEGGPTSSASVNAVTTDKVSGQWLERAIDWRLGHQGEFSNLRLEGNTGSIIALLQQVQAVEVSGYFEANEGVVWELGGSGGTAVAENIKISESFFSESGSGAGIFQLRNCDRIEIRNNNYYTSSKTTIRTPSSNFVGVTNSYLEYASISFGTAISSLSNALVPNAGMRNPGRGDVYALVRLSGNQNISNNSATAVSWTTEDSDTGGFWVVGSPTIFTVPSGVTRVRVNAMIVFDANATGSRRVLIEKNSSTSYVGRPEMRVPAAASGTTVVSLSTPILVVSAGDTFRVMVTQDSGGSLDVSSGNNSWFAIEAVG